MTRMRILTAVIVTGVSASLAGPVAGQEEESGGQFSGATVELAGHGGLMFFDVEGTELATGGRLALHLPNGLGFAAAVDRATRAVELDDETDDAVTWFYAGEIHYTIPSATRAHFFGFLGFGQARFDASGLEEESLGADDRTETLIPVGLGLRWYNHPGAPWWALRAEFRDNIVIADEDEAAGRDDEVTNNYQLSFGLALLLGGRPTPTD